MTISKTPAPCWVGPVAGGDDAGARLAARRMDAAGLAAVLRDGGEPAHVVASADHARVLDLCLEAPARVATLTLLSPPPFESLDPAFVARLKSLEVPTLVLFGALSSHEPAAPGTRWRRALGKAFLVYVFDAVDPIEASRPGAVADVTGDFIARRDGFLVRARDDRLNP